MCTTSYCFLLGLHEPTCANCIFRLWGTLWRRLDILTKQGDTLIFVAAFIFSVHTAGNCLVDFHMPILLGAAQKTALDLGIMTEGMTGPRACLDLERQAWCNAESSMSWCCLTQALGLHECQKADWLLCPHR